MRQNSNNVRFPLPRQDSLSEGSQCQRPLIFGKNRNPATITSGCRATAAVTAPTEPPPPADSRIENSRTSDDEVDDETLIDLVRSYKILWSTSGRGYKDTQKKNQAWKELAQIMRIGDGKHSSYIFMAD